jgi:N-acetylmuramoyl-L-alanine amidase
MALYRVGDTGDAVRDIQDRLNRLGYPVDPDEPGTFDAGTARATTEFQRANHIAKDGMVGRETWRTLVDAGFGLGDRVLYYRLPMLHGHDVADLQRRLNSLGFDAGNIDGIFGPATLRAVLEFQHNREMAEDGIVGPEVVGELTLMVRATDKVGREVVRDRVWLADLPRTVAGQRFFLDPFCRSDHEATSAWNAAAAAAAALREMGAQPLLSRSADTRPAERLRARHANELAADMVIGFSLSGDAAEAGVHHFASPLTTSRAGSAIGGAVAAALGVNAVGRSTPLLRETRAPAVVVVLPHLDPAVGRAVARAIEMWLGSDRDAVVGAD